MTGWKVSRLYNIVASEHPVKACKHKKFPLEKETKSVAEYCRVVQSIAEYYRVLQRITEYHYHRVLQGT